MAQNVYNPATGQYGYQLPGAPLQAGWQPIDQNTPPQNSKNTPASSTAGSDTTVDQNITPPNPTGVNDMSFLNMMNKLNTSFQQTNTLIDQKNAVLHASMGNPIDSKTMESLPPEIQSLISGGNRDAMRLQAQALNDQINGNGSSVASSISFLTQGYENSVKMADDQKQAEFDNLIKLSSVFVDPKTGTVDTTKMGSALQSLYPGVDMSGILNQLQGMMPVSEYNKQFYQGVIPASTSGGFPTGSQTPGSAAAVNNATGLKDPSTGTFVPFSTPEESLIATVQQLQMYQNGTSTTGINGSSTLNDATSMWVGPNPQYTGQDIANDLGVSPQTPISQLNPTQWANAIASHETGWTPGTTPQQVPTIASGATPEQIDNFLNSGPPIKAGTATYGQNTLTTAAKFDLLGIPNNILGGMGAAAGRAAMGEKESQIMEAYGLTPVDVGVAKAEFKNLSSANAKIINQATFVKTYTATANDNLELALAQSPQVTRTDSRVINSIFQKYQTDFTKAPDLSKWEVYIYTAAREYAKVTSGGAMSAQGLTDSAVREVSKLLAVKDSPEAFKAEVEAMKQDMGNVNKEFDNTISGFAPSVANLLGFATGGASSNIPGTSGPISSTDIKQYTPIKFDIPSNYDYNQARDRQQAQAAVDGGADPATVWGHFNSLYK